MASELLEEFIFDAREHLATAGNQLLELEKSPDSLSCLNALLGTLHTIKGNSGFVNLNNLYSLLHSSENLLQTVRETPAHTCPHYIINQLFQVLDTVEAILSRLQNDQDDTVEWLAALNEAVSEAEASLTSPANLGYDQTLQDSSTPGGQDKAEKNTAVKVTAAKNAPDLAAGGLTTSAPLINNNVKLSDQKSKEPYKVIKLTDGQLASEGEAFVKNLLSQLKSELKGLVLDLGDLTSFSPSEMRLLSVLGSQLETRLALVLDKEANPDFWRVFHIWSLDNRLHFYPKQSEALSALAAL